MSSCQTNFKRTSNPLQTHLKRSANLRAQDCYRGPELPATATFEIQCIQCIRCIQCIHCTHCLHCMHCAHCMHCIMSYDDCNDCHNVLYRFGHHLVIIWTSFGHDSNVICTSFGHPLRSFGYHSGMIWTCIGHHCEMIWNRKSASKPPPSSELIFPKPPKPQKIQTSTHRLLQRSAAEAAACKSGRGRRPSDSPLNNVPSVSQKPPWEVRRSLSEGPDFHAKVNVRVACLV